MKNNLVDLQYGMHNLLKSLMDQKGSDLHIANHSPPRVRINGKLFVLDTPPLSASQSRALCYSILNEKQHKEFEKNKELDFSFALKGVGRFRGNVYHQKKCVAGAFRAIPEEVPSAKELGLPVPIVNFSKLNKGLVLVCGATGSGKSTTLASLINEVNKNSRGTIITIEDPIEYVHSHKNSMVVQREVYRDTLSFSKALKSALRQDPDVIMVGEVRDLETIQLMLTAAETGHLVFATMHTNSAVSTLNRIVDSFPPEQQSQVRSQLAFTLSGIVNQVLTPSLKGGRVLVLEVMVPNVAIKNLIRENKLHMIYSAMQTGQDNSGMMTMNQSLFKLIQQKFITQNQAMRLSNVPTELMDMFQGKLGKFSA
ncbi:MAG: type IV pilus twitching motility protein PilT [Proteobacteria bacterium]|nr:type IV pilus twitching motility protein PilT [Pseudomonadota bacterium]